MERLKADIAYAYVSGIDRNYPDQPSTFGACRTDECGNSARGCGYCADCYEKKLAELVGAYQASKYHDAVKEKAEAYRQIFAAANKDS